MPVSVSHIIDALASLGGQAHLDQIVERVCEIAPPPLPVDVGASVRGRIQERCSQAQSYKNNGDLFESVYGIAARRGVWRLRQDNLSETNPDAVFDGADVDIESAEGRAQLRIHLRRERSRKLVSAFKASLENHSCCVCGFDFEAAYGKIGAGYIEAHHIVPVASLDEGAVTKLSDLVALCANCHRMIHRNGLMDVEELKKMLGPWQKAG